MDRGRLGNMMKCVYCQAKERQMKAGFTGAGSQRYRCGKCGRRYTPEPKAQGYSDGLRAQAVKLYADGLNYRRIGRILGIDHVTAMIWIKGHVEQLPSKAPLPARVEAIELDRKTTRLN